MAENSGQFKKGNTIGKETRCKVGNFGSLFFKKKKGGYHIKNQMF